MRLWDLAVVWNVYGEVLNKCRTKNNEMRFLRWDFCISCMRYFPQYWPNLNCWDRLNKSDSCECEQSHSDCGRTCGVLWCSQVRPRVPRYSLVPWSQVQTTQKEWGHRPNGVIPGRFRLLFETPSHSIYVSCLPSALDTLPWLEHYKKRFWG